MNNDTLLIQRSTMPVDRVVAGNDKISIVNPRSITYLKAFGKCEQRNLPPEYTQIEYLESTGTQWIDTHIPLNNSLNLKIFADVNTGNITEEQAIVGNNGGAYIELYFNSNAIALYNGQATHAKITTTTSNTRWTIDAQMTPTSLSIDANGLTGSDTGSLTSSDDRSFTLLRHNGLYYFKGKTYAIKLWIENLLVADFIPVRIGTTGYMYDRVSGQLFGNDGTGDFVLGPDAVPAPDKPIDIVSNNGVLKARHQSGLPLGYTLLESITGYASQSVINSGVAGNNDNLRIVIRASKDTSAGYAPLFANYIDEASNVTRVIAGYSVGQVIFNMNRQSGNSDSINGVKFTDVHTYELYKTSDGISTLKVDGEVAGTSANIQGTANSTNIALGNSRVLAAQPSSLVSTYWYFYFCKIYDDGVLIRDYVPVKRDSDNVVGVYDLVNNTFDAGQYPNFAPFTAGATVSDPVEIYTDGTVETINVHGKNLFDINSVALLGVRYTPTVVGNNIEAVAGSNTNTSSRISIFIPVSFFKENTTYYFNSKSDTSFNINRCTIGKSTPDSTADSHYYGTISQKENNGYSGSFTITDIAPDQEYVSIFYYLGEQDANTKITISDIQIEQGSTATDYQPYYNGGTATAEMLLKVGDYQDQQDIISGDVTRRVGVKVLDGTENWVALSNSRGYYTGLFNDLIDVPYTTTFGYCTHFDFIRWDYQTTPFDTNKYSYNKDSNRPGCNGNITFRPDLSVYSTVQLWQEYLADQYAAGTPVIIVYPLASPIEEFAESQSITSKSGTNIVEVVESEIDNLDLEIRYRQK